MAWSRAGFPMDGSLPRAVTLSDEPFRDWVSVPNRLFKKMGKLIANHNDARERPSDIAKRLFSGSNQQDRSLGDSLRPLVDQWLSVTNWFVKRVHDSGRVDADDDVEEFRDNFKMFEITLGALVKGFFTTTEDLDEILEDANS
ncbi:MAG: hypothetical protein SWE60_03250 [Thermodesulfobacteriota bacterium]|nr:hypothetical protein [Thermodesulfobacteriota bacterium]